MRLAPACDLGLVDAAGTVARDTACRKCGYNLRGLRPETRCPECAAPVLETLQGNFLRFASRPWCARIAAGVDWMLWAGVGVVLATLLTFVQAVRIPTKPLIFLLQLAGYYGVWLCTTPEPARFETGASLRRWARVGAITWLALRVVGWLLRASPVGSFAGEFFGACAGFATDVVVLMILMRLATRMPDERLAQRIATCTWFYALGAVVVLAQGLTAWLCYLFGVWSPTANEFLHSISIFIVGLVLVMLIARLFVLYATSKALGASTEERPEIKAE